MSKEILRIGVPSKGRIRSGCIDILKKKKIKVFSERGDRDLFGIVKKMSQLWLKPSYFQSEEAHKTHMINLLHYPMKLG